MMTGGDAEAPRRPGRKKKLPDEVVKQHMLEAATDLLTPTGLRVGLDHLSLEEVILEAKASRSAVYRIWPTKDDFYLELLLHLAGPEWQGTAAFDQETLDTAEGIVMARLDDLRTPKRRRSLLLEVIRVAVARNYQALSTSMEWKSHLAILATISSMPEADGVLVMNKLQATEAGFVQKMIDFYSGMLALLGLKLKEPFDLNAMTALGASVLEGLSLRASLIPALSESTFKFGGEEWSLSALGYLAIIDAVTEPDPEYDADAAITSYMEHRAVEK